MDTPFLENCFELLIKDGSCLTQWLSRYSPLKKQGDYVMWDFAQFLQADKRILTHCLGYLSLAWPSKDEASLINCLQQNNTRMGTRISLWPWENHLISPGCFQISRNSLAIVEFHYSKLQGTMLSGNISFFLIFWISSLISCICSLVDSGLK